MMDLAAARQFFEIFTQSKPHGHTDRSELLQQHMLENTHALERARATFVTKINEVVHLTGIVIPFGILAAQ